jgi:hypothetical protein
MVENEERKQTKGKDLKMGGGKNRVCGGGPSFGRILKMGDNYNRRFSLQISNMYGHGSQRNQINGSDL